MRELKKFAGKQVMITGACGTVGKELLRQILHHSPARVVCVDNNESMLFFLQQAYVSDKRVECYLTDIRDQRELQNRMIHIDIVLHAAALKHVGLCEESPVQAIRTNIDGTQNIIDAAIMNDVERVLFTSSDKAVNPTNVMGTSKLMGERLMTAASQSKGKAKTIFASTRFGNVLGSSGSVVPLFRKQIAEGGPMTLTDAEMTRFIMTLDAAAKLVLRSVWMAEGGEVFVPKMPIARIEDLAVCVRDIVAPDSDVEIEVIGAKPGEKLYEELMNEEEVRRTFELDDYFVVLSAFTPKVVSIYPLIEGRKKATRPYNSSIEMPMSRDALKTWLLSNKLLN